MYFTEKTFELYEKYMASWNFIDAYFMQKGNTIIEKEELIAYWKKLYTKKEGNKEEVILLYYEIKWLEEELKKGNHPIREIGLARTEVNKPNYHFFTNEKAQKLYQILREQIEQSSEYLYSELLEDIKAFFIFYRSYMAFIKNPIYNGEFRECYTTRTLGEPEDFLDIWWKIRTKREIGSVTFYQAVNKIFEEEETIDSFIKFTESSLGIEVVEAFNKKNYGLGVTVCRINLEAIKRILEENYLVYLDN